MSLELVMVKSPAAIVWVGEETTLRSYLLFSVHYRSVIYTDREISRANDSILFLDSRPLKVAALKHTETSHPRAWNRILSLLMTLDFQQTHSGMCSGRQLTHERKAYQFHRRSLLRLPARMDLLFLYHVCPMSIVLIFMPYAGQRPFQHGTSQRLGSKPRRRPMAWVPDPSTRQPLTTLDTLTIGIPLE